MLHTQLPYITSILPSLHLLQSFSFPHQCFAVEFLHLFIATTFARAKIDGLAIASRESDEFEGCIRVRDSGFRDASFETSEGPVAEEDYSYWVTIREGRER
jgi:hypothetical protein